MWLVSFLKWLEATGIATGIRENELLFPLIESIHVLATTLVFGVIAVVDLRLLGLASVGRRTTRLMAELLPFTWISFAVSAITGTLLFSSNAAVYAKNFYFDFKLILMALAGVNVFVFHFFMIRGIAVWDASAQTPLRAKIAGGISLLLWVGVVFCGRWIGFTMI
jgi:hypothetical protein